MVKGRDITFFQILNEVSSILYWILHSFLNDWLCTCCSSLPNGLPLASSSNSTTPPTFSWGTFSLPTILCDSGEVAQHSQLEFWIGAAMDDPVSAAYIPWSWSRYGHVTPALHMVSFLRTLCTDTNEGHFLLWPQTVKIEACMHQQPHPLFL